MPQAARGKYGTKVLARKVERGIIFAGDPLGDALLPEKAPVGVAQGRIDVMRPLFDAFDENHLPQDV
jgi:hypothetical protein